MGKKSSPPPPDYTGAAEKTAASNLQYAQYQTQANRPNQTTPWGSSTWTQDPSDPNKWSQNIALAGPQQQALDQQMAIQAGKSDIAGGMLGRLNQATATPFDWSNMTPMAGVPQAGGLQAGYLGTQQMRPGQQIQAGNLEATGDRGRQRIEQGLFNRMQPQHEQQQAGLETQLQGMGLTRGSEAWNREKQNLGDQQSREMYDAMQTAGQEQQRQFGMEQQAGAQNFGQQAQASQQNWQQRLATNQQNFAQRAQAGQQNFAQQQGMLGQNFQQGMQAADYQNRLRQQQIQEQQLQRSMPLNELNALLTGSQVAQPTFGGFAQQGQTGGANYSGAAQSQYGGAMDQYNAQQAQSQGLMSGIGSVAGMAAMFMSDERLKTNIVRVGTHPLGVGVYEYDIDGRHEWGVMAQELATVAPHLVLKHPSGYLMVNYGGL